LRRLQNPFSHLVADVLLAGQHSGYGRRGNPALLCNLANACHKIPSSTINQQFTPEKSPNRANDYSVFRLKSIVNRNSIKLIQFYKLMINSGLSGVIQ
jgi:hypothetical protein